MRRWVAIAIGLGIASAARVSAASLPTVTLLHDRGDVLVPGQYVGYLEPGAGASVAVVDGLHIPQRVDEGLTLPCDARLGPTTLTLFAGPTQLTAPLPVTVAAPTLTFQALNGVVYGGEFLQLTPNGSVPAGPLAATLHGARLLGYGGAKGLWYGFGGIGVTLPADAATGSIRVTDCESTGVVPITIAPPRFTQTTATARTPHAVIELNGNYLGMPGGINTITVNGKPLPSADLALWEEGGIQVRVPGSIQAGQYHIMVVTGGGTSNPATITVEPGATVAGDTGAGWGAPLPGTAPVTPVVTAPITGTAGTGEAPPPKAIAGNGSTSSGTGGSSTSGGTGGSSTNRTSDASRTMSIDGPAMLNGSGTYRVSPGAVGVTWASSDPPVIAINPVTGVATALQPGRATISAVAGGRGATLKVVSAPHEAIPSRAVPAKTPQKAGTVKTLGLFGGATALAGLALLLILRRRRKKTSGG